ncbi:MAG: hypothetical protein L0Y45_08250 [Woeseiaceae bacterium]|nr:hypothetical protein [Woeseiaceae bacterium]
MIYYYYKSKEGLYLAVLKESYRRIRDVETEFQLEGLPRMFALRRLVEIIVDYQATHSDLIRVIMTENIHNGAYIRQLPDLKPAHRRAFELIKGLCKRGVEEGVFRSDFDPVDLHMSICALSFFNVSDQHTFGYLSDREFTDKAVHSARRAAIVDTIARYAQAP